MERLKKMKEFISIGAEKVSNVSTFEHPATFLEDTTPVSLKSFIENLRINILACTSEELVADVSGIDVSLANALRRIMIAEVATMAIEKVTVYQNTSVIPDEVLAHRLGLIPILADPNLFVCKDGNVKVKCLEHSEYDDKNAIKFSLHVKCYKHKDKGTVNQEVLSDKLKWVPMGDQEERFADAPVKPVHSDILIAKLRPGQEIEAEMVCEKGIGQTHAKWSPVATAYYRLLPRVTLSEEVAGQEAIKIRDICPMGVFDIEDAGEVRRLKVKDSRKCTACRECLRIADSKVVLEKFKNHFECTCDVSASSR